MGFFFTFPWDVCVDKKWFLGFESNQLFSDKCTGIKDHRGALYFGIFGMNNQQLNQLTRLCIIFE